MVPPGDGGALGDLVLVGPLELVFSSSAPAAPGAKGALPALPPLLPGGPGAGVRPSIPHSVPWTTCSQGRDVVCFVKDYIVQGAYKEH